MFNVGADGHDEPRGDGGPRRAARGLRSPPARTVPGGRGSQIDIGDYYADDSKLRSTLGWAPEIGLEQGLATTLDYYREHGERYWGDR